MKSCCFIGHRKIENISEVEEKVKKMVLELIQKEDVKIFLFGSKSEFNNICYNVVTQLKEIYKDLKRVFCSCKGEVCLLENQRNKIENILSNYKFNYFDEEMFFKYRNSAHKFGYIQRNKALINRSDFCIFFYNKNYIPKSKQAKNGITANKSQSGTALAYNYAVNKQKNIINIFS